MMVVFKLITMLVIAFHHGEKVFATCNTLSCKIYFWIMFLNRKKN